MHRQMNKNRGFTLIELLISMALLSIIMLMVVQFMSSTSAAEKKTKQNLKVQEEANEVMTNMADSLMQANYICVIPSDSYTYLVDKTSGQRTESLTSTAIADLTSDKGADVTFRLVSDNYGNYVRVSDKKEDERKVIIDMDTYQLLGEKKDTVYPLSGDLETPPLDVRSFRVLKQEISGKETYIYIKPAYIYAEYTVSGTNPDGTSYENLCNVIYRFEYTADGGNIYMYRSSEDVDLGKYTAGRLDTAKGKVDALSDETGRLTKNLTDFYLSADAEGNALLTDALFEINGYKYNSADTVNFRNSEVLTVRPQNTYKKAGTGSGSGGTTP